MSKSDHTPQRIEDQPARNKPIDVQFPKVLHRRDPSLILPIHITLQPSPHILQHLIDYTDRKVRMIPLQVVRQHRQQRNVRVSQLIRLCEHFPEILAHFRVRPIEPAEELQDLVDRLLGKNVVHEVSNELFHRRSLFLLSGSPFRRICLVVRVLEHQLLALVEVLHALLALHQFEHLRKSLFGLVVSEQETTTAFEEHGDIIDIGAGEVVETDLEDVEDEVRRDDFELGEGGEEGDILWINTELVSGL